MAYIWLVRDFACVMPTQTIFEVVGQTSVETREACFALKNVNVGKIHFLACRVVVRSACRKRPRKPAFARGRTAARQSSFCAGAPNEDWRRRELNPRP